MQSRLDAPDHTRPRRVRACVFGVALAFVLGAVNAQAATHTVGPASAGACGGADCDYQSVQAAIDAAAAGDTITVYRRTDDAANNECYDEHLIITTASLTIQGNSTTPTSAACIGPSTGGNIVRVSASGVTLEDLHISGKANNGAGGTNSKGLGGRSAGHGVYVQGDDIDNAVIKNCTIDFSAHDNIRFDGDQDGDGDGSIQIKQCYLHHADTMRNIRIIGGGGSTGDRHIIRNNLIHTGQGVLLGGGIDYATVEKNIIKGWPYWGHLGGAFPEVRTAGFGGGWRYYSNSLAGVWVTDPAPTNLTINNNLIVGTRWGIRVNADATIRNNTIVNPFNAIQYDYNGTIAATAVRDNTYGIMIADGFGGTIQNNVITVTDDNRATGEAGQASGTYYTPGITGYGIAFGNNTGTLGGGANISHNNVWGFVDTDGTTALNYGSGITPDKTNLSTDPEFATDLDDESNGGSGPCLADGNDAGDTRCYDLHVDNFFLGSTQTEGSCHGSVLENTAGAADFVDLSDGGSRDADTHGMSGLDDCSPTADAADSRAIDFGTGSVADEPGLNGSAPNLGAFGGTERASKSPTLRIAAVDVGGGTVKNGDAAATVPGVIQPGSAGLTEVNVYFNRAVSATSSSFLVRDLCDTVDLTAPVSVDTSGASASPYVVTLTWNTGTFTDEAVRIHVLGDGADRVVDLDSAQALDGEISDPDSGTMPSGDATAGGDAQFVVYSMVGDVDGDGVVEGQSGEDDYEAVTGYAGYPAGSCSGCPQDLDDDGDVDADDLAVVTGNDNGGWYDLNWPDRRRITIDSAKVATVSSTDLSSFPVLINTTNADWKTIASGGKVAQSDGGDILFTSGATPLDHEIQSYDPVTGALVAWVEVPTVSASANTAIDMYYGNAGAADQWNVAGTWDGSYEAVWHLDEDPGDVLEFDTANTTQSSMIPVSGDVYAIAYTGDAGDGWLATVDINADGSIDNAVLDTLEFDVVTAGEPDIVHVSGDIFAIAYVGAATKGELVTVDIDAAGTIGNSVVDSFTFDASNAGSPELIPVSGDIHAIIYTDSSFDAVLKTLDIATNGTINGTVDTLVVDTTGKQPTILPVSGDIFAVAYEGPTFDGWLTTVDIDPTGTPLSVVDTLEFDTADAASPDLVKVSGDIYAVVYEGSNDDGFIKTLDIDASGTPLSVVTTLEFDADEGQYPSIVSVSGDIFAVAYEAEGHGGALESGHVLTLDIDPTGAPISAVDALDHDTSQGNFPVIMPVTGDVFAVAYSGPDDDGYVKTLDITATGLIGEFPDSTTNGAYAQGVAATATGQIGSAVDLDGTDDFLRLSNAGTYDAGLDATGALTLSLWFYPDDVDSILFDNRWGDSVQENGYVFETDASGNLVFSTGDNTNAGANGVAVGSSTVTAGQWNHLTVTKAAGSSTINFYLDGAAAGSDTVNSSTITYDAGELLRVLGTSTDPVPYGGADGFGSRQFTDGRIDELRVSTTDRSADWVVTSYNNQNSPSTFYTVGCAEEP